MKIPNKMLQKNKALLAIAFASTIASSPIPAFSGNNAESTSSMAQMIAKNAHLSPETNAYYLLYIARDYLAGIDKKQIESSFYHLATQPDNSIFRNPRSGRQLLGNWTKQLCENNFFNEQDNYTTSNISEWKKEKNALAKSALDLAFTQLEKSTDTYAKLNMYFIALRMYEKIHSAEGRSKCEKIIEENVQSCEASSEIDEEKMEACYAVLNLMAAVTVPVSINERETKIDPSRRKFIVNSYTEGLFKESERTRLRAVAITDKLDGEKHLRRKAHRDMALWYSKLDKNDLADKQKQVLFDLVGIHDDCILYPVEAGCGHLVWWKKENSVFGVECGMG